MIPGEESMQDVISQLELIPKSGFLPVGRYRFVVERAIDFPAKDGKKRQFNYELRVIESIPDGFKGTPYTERFTLGTDAHPEGKDPAVIQSRDNYGAMAYRRFKEILGNNGTQIVGVTQAAEGKDGTTRVNVNQWYPPNVKLSELAAPSVEVRKRKPAPGAPTTPAPAAAPQQPFTVQHDDDDEPTLPAAAPAAATPAVSQGEQQVPCIAGCGAMIARSQLLQHAVDKHGFGVQAPQPQARATVATNQE